MFPNFKDVMTLANNIYTVLLGIHADIRHMIILLNELNESIAELRVDESDTIDAT